MSLLLRSIIRGLGWELGKTAATEAVDELRASGADHEQLQREALKTKRNAERAARAAEKAEKKAKKARAKEMKRRECEVDAELAALKRSVEREP